MRKEHEIILFDKLNRFINKYYKNKILKGVIFLIGALLCFLLFFSLIEYFSRFNKEYREILYWSYIIINLIILIKFIITPLFHLFRFGAVIDYTYVAKVIGRHFPEIDDKIINVLELRSLSLEDAGLINASIKQKIEDIQPFSFSSIIKFRENRKHLKWVIVPTFIFLFLLFSGNKHIVTESSARIIDYENEYIPAAPFQFNIPNNKLEVAQQEDFLLELEIIGEKIPSKVYIEINGNRFSLIKDNINNYHYLFKNVIQDVSFRFFAEGYYSGYYTLKSLPMPYVLGFNIYLNPPSYTKMKNEKFENIGDLSIPEGTKVKWEFDLKNVESITFKHNKMSEDYHVEKNKLIIKKSRLNDGKYSITTNNKYFVSEETYYKIDIIKDEYPEIEVKQDIDSSNSIIFFNGQVSDDYSLSKLVFHYTVKNQDSSSNYSSEIDIHKLSYENFHHFLDLNSIAFEPEDQILYYFEVWDNDEINGNKSSKSLQMAYSEISKEELEKRRDQENLKIKTEINNTIELSKQIQKEIDDLQKSIINKKTLGWEEKKKVESIFKKQKNLEEIIKKNNARNNKNNKNQEKLNSSILEKQKQLEKLMDKVLDEESKKIMEDLLNLFDEIEKEKVKEALDKIEENNADIEKELDRNLELYKELEFEQTLDETINKIESLKEKQKELKEKTENKNSEVDSLLEEQEKLEEELNRLEESLKKLEQQNSDLENKKDIPDLKSEKEKVKSGMNKSKESLIKNQKKSSSKKQDEVIKNLEEMSEKMSLLKSSCSNDQPVENMETLRQILENLITLSFDQEELIKKISNLPRKSNNIVNHIQEQQKLFEDAKIIEDSLLALSKRVVQMESIINKEISSINYNIEKAISLLEERKISRGVSKQQFVMTSLNNLALLLSETLKQMQMDIANKTPGEKQCNKPGSSSNPSLKELKKMQKELLKQMQENKAGNKGEGKKRGNRSEEESRMLMNLANQQEMIRLRLQELRDEIGKSGNKGNIDKIIEEMEKNETDILNNNITEETILRQQEILTRLLEAEESQRERDEEKERESVQWDYEIDNKSDDYIEYIQKKKNQEELIKTTPIQLNKFYKEKVNKYFKNITNQD